MNRKAVFARNTFLEKDERKYKRKGLGGKAGNQIYSQL